MLCVLSGTPWYCHPGMSSCMVSDRLTVVTLLLPWMPLTSWCRILIGSELWRAQLTRQKACLGDPLSLPSLLFSQPLSMLLTPERLRPKQVVFQSEEFNSDINRVLCSGSTLRGLEGEGWGCSVCRVLELSADRWRAGRERWCDPESPWIPEPWCQAVSSLSSVSHLAPFYADIRGVILCSSVVLTCFMLLGRNRKPQVWGLAKRVRGVNTWLSG